MEAIELNLNHKSLAPIGSITFHLYTSLYKYVNGKIEKIPNERIEPHTTLPLYWFDKERDLFEVAPGKYVQDVMHTKIELDVGKIFTKAPVKVCSRTGRVQRMMEAGVVVNVIAKEISPFDPSLIRFQIGKDSFLTSLEPVDYWVGRVKFTHEEVITNNGNTKRLMPDVAYYYDRVEGEYIHLSAEDIWVNLTARKGYSFE